jgi:nickel-type superoxide dismutase maturation protease
VQCLAVYTDGVSRPLREWLPVRRFVVADTSMRPALEPGDRLLVCSRSWPWRGAANARLRPGDIVVFREPDRHLSFAVKRIASVTPAGGVEVRGDNVNVSRDSRAFGPLTRAQIVGRVIYRYLPRQRRGRPR